MNSSNVSSLEKLDQLLSEGRISEDEYMRLSRALESRTEEEQTGGTHTHASRPPLSKSASDCVLGGVCAGLAEHLNVDRTLVRLTTAVLGFLVLPLTLLIYLALYFTLPWDDPDAVQAQNNRGMAWWFLVLNLMILTVIPIFISRWILQDFAALYHELGANLPAPTRLIFHVADLYRSFWGVALSLLLVALVTLIDTVFQRKNLRILIFMFYGFLLLLSGLAVVALYLPLFNMPKVIRPN